LRGSCKVADVAKIALHRLNLGIDVVGAKFRHVPVRELVGRVVGNWRDVEVFLAARRGQLRAQAQRHGVRK
nr:hypothetical protein [Tanacetum cinerariifolium]